MPDVEPPDPLELFHAVLDRYLAGSAPLSAVLAARHTLPAGASVNVQLQPRAVGMAVPVEVQARLDALGPALEDRNLSKRDDG